MLTKLRQLQLAGSHDQHQPITHTAYVLNQVKELHQYKNTNLNA